MNYEIKVNFKKGGIALDNRAEVIINTDDQHSIRIEVRNEDVQEIVNKYALLQDKEPKYINILDFLNFREN